MENKNIIKKYLEENNYNFNDKSNGINIDTNNNEVLIKGNTNDLIELADYILSIALSQNNNDHIHLDDLTIIDNNSKIKELIIEKDNN